MAPLFQLQYKQVQRRLAEYWYESGNLSTYAVICTEHLMKFWWQSSMMNYTVLSKLACLNCMKLWIQLAFTRMVNITTTMYWSSLLSCYFIYLLTRVQLPLCWTIKITLKMIPRTCGRHLLDSDSQNHAFWEHRKKETKFPWNIWAIPDLSREQKVYWEQMVTRRSPPHVFMMLYYENYYEGLVCWH